MILIPSLPIILRQPFSTGGEGSLVAAGEDGKLYPDM